MVLGEILAHHADKRLQDTVDGQQLLAATTAAQAHYSSPLFKPTAQPSQSFTYTMDADQGTLAFGQIV